MRLLAVIETGATMRVEPEIGVISKVSHLLDGNFPTQIPMQTVT